MDDCVGAAYIINYYAKHYHKTFWFRYKGGNVE